MAKQTLKQFQTNTLGKTISGWSRTGGQCVDYVRKYIQLCLIGNTTDRTLGWISGGNAHDFFHNANPKYFKKIRNSPTYVPKPGTIVVLNHGTYGHVFIIRGDVKSTVRLMYTIEQNWSWPRHVTKEAHRFVELIGFLEPIVLPKVA